MAYKPSFNAETGIISIMCRLSYCHMFKKTASTEGGKLAYRMNGLLDKSTKEGKMAIQVVEKAIEHLKKKEWPGKNPKFDTKRFPLRDGDDYTNDDGDIRDGYEGMMYVPMSNDRKVKLRDRDGQEEVTEEDDKIYSGAFAIAKFHIYAVKNKDKGGNGIFATIDGLQWVKHGERFGGGGIDDDEFEDLGDENDDDFDEPKGKSSSKSSRRSSIDDDDEI